MASSYHVPDVLSSLRKYASVRSAASFSEIRAEDNNLDVLLDEETGERIGLCHLTSLLAMTVESTPSVNGFQDMSVIALAAQHLNTGDGSIVAQVAGLNDRCKVRFTVESIDTELDSAMAVKRVSQLANRAANGPKPRPCAFIGEYISSISIRTAIVTGLLGYPQVSPTATTAELDDKSQFPLFGRTVPSDAGNAVPVILFFRDILRVQHLAVINVNDAYGNAYVDGMRRAAQQLAPDMVINQVPLEEGSIKLAINSLKGTKFRFIFAVTLTEFDELLAEAYAQDVAGDGLHNWVFSEGFLSNLDRKSFEKGSPLHLAYRGVSMVSFTSGFPGLPAFDNYESTISKLWNPSDLSYLSVLANSTEDVEPLTMYTNPLGPFAYEAAIALGLAACNAISDDLVLTGEAHFAALKETMFDGVSGSVSFQNDTCSRNASGTLYVVINYVEEEKEGMVSFKPVMTNLFQEAKWTTLANFTFNDGTSVLPRDLPPLADGQNVLPVPVLVVVSVLCFAILGLLFILAWERKRKSNDMGFHIKKEALKYSDPPQILGRGSFGYVFLAEYRGTKVAVKRVVVPPKSSYYNGATSSNIVGSWLNSGKYSKGGHDSSTVRNIDNISGSEVNCGVRSGMSSGVCSGMCSGVHSGMNSGFKDSGSWTPLGKVDVARVEGPRKSEDRLTRRVKEDFVEDIRFLSRLRHSCVTSILGVVREKGEDLMLVMEYMNHGSLYDLLRNETVAIEEEILLPILIDISQGVRFLHSTKPQVIHGDLKAQNILVDSRFRAKVTDFGLSNKMNMSGTGSPFWMAPELLRGESANTAASDVYSFGITIYEVYSRKDPYEGEIVREVLCAVANKNIRKRPIAPLSMPTEIRALMSDCLNEESENRPSFEEVDIRLDRMYSISKTKASSQVSLFDIFPRNVAEALRDGRKVEATHRDIVTIFFSDIVGFTDIASHLEPQQIANMLDRLYHKFDDLSCKHDLYKVETIGDSYMAVSNLIKNQNQDHCKRIAEFAIEAVAAANETLIDSDDPSKGYVNIRVGFHSGPVVADVVGTRNPRYCLFGDAVNTASRMESNSGVNRINCSEKSALILKQQCENISIRPRGQLLIKGKGKMKCFWVNEEGEQPNHALERVRRNQNVGVLEAKYDVWCARVPPSTSKQDEPLPQQQFDETLLEDEIAESMNIAAAKAFDQGQQKHLLTCDTV